MTRMTALASPSVLSLTAPAAYPPSKNPVLVYLATLGSDHSRRTMKNGLRRLLRVAGSPLEPEAFTWHLVDYEHAVAFRAMLTRTHEAPSVNQSLAALKGVLKQAYLLRLVEGDTWTRVREGLKSVRSKRVRRGRPVREEDVCAILGACDRSDFLGIRDAAVIAVFCATGCRRSELCGLVYPRDVDLKTGDVVFHGKGNKERDGYLGDALIEVKAWLEIRGEEPGALFWGQKSSGKAWDKRGLTEGGVYDLLKRAAARAGVDPWPRPHGFRHKLISDLLQKGVDLVTVQAIVGHDDPRTTADYDDRERDTRREAAGKIRIPR